MNDKRCLGRYLYLTEVRLTIDYNQGKKGEKKLRYKKIEEEIEDERKREENRREKEREENRRREKEKEENRRRENE